MAKKYLATYDDVQIISGTRLQLKTKPTSKHISDCTIGDIIKLPETVGGVRALHDYIVVEKHDEYVIVLRKYVDASGRFAGDDLWYAAYDGNGSTRSTIDLFCTETMYGRYSQILKDYLYPINIIVRKNTSDSISLERSIFIPSSYNYYGGVDIEHSNDTIWFNDSNDRITYLESNIGYNPVTYWTRTFTNSGATTSYFYTIVANGNSGSAKYNTTQYYRPAVSLSANTPLNSNNEFEDTIVYTDSVETISYGDRFYKINDTEGRIADNIVYDNTASGLESASVQDAIDELVLTGQKVEINNNDLVLKYSSDNILISDLELGTSIYIPETENNVTTNIEYILVEKYEGTVTVLRKDLITSRVMDSTKSKVSFYDTELYTWLNNDFLTRFSKGISDNFIEKLTLCNKNLSTIVGEQIKVGVPSIKEMLNSGNDGHSYWGTYTNGAIAKYNGTAQMWWSRTQNVQVGTYKCFNSSGSWDNMFGNSAFYVRPWISITESAIVDTNNILQSYSRTYSGTIDSIQEENNYYKIKDIDGRVSSNITYDNTTSGMTATTVKAAIDELSDATNDFYLVTVTSKTGDTVTLDKTAGEILAAFEAGKTVWCKLMVNDYYPLTEVYVDNVGINLQFANTWVDIQGDVRFFEIQIEAASSSTNTASWITREYLKNEPDITISGTFSNSGSDYPNAASIAAADFSTTKTFNELLTKIETDGELILDGCLTRDDVLVLSGQTFSGTYTKYCALKINCSAICDETLTAELATAMQINIDADTKIICCRINTGGFTINPPMLCIYLYNNEIQFTVNTQV